MRYFLCLIVSLWMTACALGGMLVLRKIIVKPFMASVLVSRVTLGSIPLLPATTDVSLKGDLKYIEYKQSAREQQQWC